VIARTGGASAALLLAAIVVSAASSRADSPTTRSHAAVYDSLDPLSIEHVTSAQALQTELAQPNVAPTRIWKLLEHAEILECLSCIPQVAKLLYDGNAKNREISAWWLRRRPFGVFGPGEVYSGVLATLSDAGETEFRRAYAANAIGEFLLPAGVPYVAKAALEDPSPRVRAAAVLALARLNDEGPEQQLGRALADPDESVRLAALSAVLAINVFTSREKIAERFGDGSSAVRRRAAEIAGALKLADAIAGLSVLSSEASESDPGVRAAAAWALGQLADPQAGPALSAALSDSNSLVRDAARIALQRL
jgi:hypothetical protein